MAHTPGPWRLIDATPNGRGGISIVVANHKPNEYICDIFPWGARPGGSSRPVADHLDNARLIAAAPDLLSALIELRDNGPSRFAWDKVNEAITKATVR